MGKGRCGEDEEFSLTQCGAGLCCAIFIAVVVIIIAAFGVVEPNEMAIKYYGMSASLERGSLYGAGRQFVGPFNSFILYKKTNELVQMPPISARTKDGLRVDLNVTFLYKYINDLKNLVQLYEMFGDKQGEDAYVEVAHGVFRDVASDFTAFGFYSNRTLIALNMRTELDAALLPYGAFS